MSSSDCELCAGGGGRVLWRDARLRVVRVADPLYPGFCRIIWNAHVREMTDLAEADREHLMRVVFAVERTVRDTVRPDKINLASLGNIVPHLHWHVIPRFADDPHFPNPIWGERRRERPRAAPAGLDDALAAALAAALG